MKTGTLRYWILGAILIGAAAGLGWALSSQLQKGGLQGPQERARPPAPVDVEQIARGPIELRRVFTGTLEATAEFVVAPKVSGRVERLFVSLSDTVTLGQTVAELDNAEYVQAVAQAQADLMVARANLAEARSALENTKSEFARTQSLRKRGIASDSDFDAVRANLQAKQAQLHVAEAGVIKAEASLKTARIRLGYTKVTASWTDGDEQRIVAERYVDEGQTVAANVPLLSIVEFKPIKGVIFVSERDYGRLKPGLPVSILTDAYPGEAFPGGIDRIAPIFRASTRQARVELRIKNPEGRLKPGMFVRATVVLDRVPDATIVPAQALTTRNDQTGVFLVGEEGRRVAWRVVEPGIQEGDRLQVKGPGLSGRVVIMGQQFLTDGSFITIPGGEGPSPRP